MAVTLDELDAWGTLDSAGLSAVASTMDGADSLSFQEASASVSCSAAVSSPEFTKAKSMSASASVASTVTADVTHIKGVETSSTSTSGAVSASAILIRLVNGQPTANVSVSATITHVQAIVATSASTSATVNSPTPNFVVLADLRTAEAVVTVSAESPVATLKFDGAAGIATAASVVASGEILGEKWAVIPDTVGVWAIQ